VCSNVLLSSWNSVKKDPKGLLEAEEQIMQWSRDKGQTIKK
jgi:hypothetical protein